MGKLRFISYAVPGSAALFSALQSAMNLGAASNQIRITKEVRHSLLAFLTLLNDLSNRPTYLAEIIPEDPLFLGATDRLRFALQAMDPICLKPSSNFLKFKGYLIVFGNYLCL